MPEWLYDEVKDDIPSHVGVSNGEVCLKKPKKVGLSLPVEKLYINLVCALNREADKYHNNLDEDVIAKYKRVISRLEKSIQEHKDNAYRWMEKYWNLKNEECEEW